MGHFQSFLWFVLARVSCSCLSSSEPQLAISIQSRIQGGFLPLHEVQKSFPLHFPHPQDIFTCALVARDLLHLLQWLRVEELEGKGWGEAPISCQLFPLGLHHRDSLWSPALPLTFHLSTTKLVGKTYECNLPLCLRLPC